MLDLRIKKILDILQREVLPVKRSDIAKEVGISESTLRNIIRDTEGKRSPPFKIEMIKGQGYILNVLDEKDFATYLSQFSSMNVVYLPSQRTEILLFYLLQADDYLTIASLEEKMLLSRSTILKELKNVEQQLAEFELTLDRRTRYGIRVVGKEADVRHAFSKYVIGRSPERFYPLDTPLAFMKILNTDRLQKELQAGLKKYEMVINTESFENILNHLRILVFRVSQNNFIRTTDFDQEIDSKYLDLARYLIQHIEGHDEVSLPESEIMFLAIHIASKINTMMLDEDERGKLNGYVTRMLRQLDEEFMTDFSNDSELKQSLILHLSPLLKRVRYHFTLDNPLIDEIQMKYSNVFVIGFRFLELFEALYDVKVSRDEAGYIVLHFAIHLERAKGQLLKKIKRVVVICSTGGGSAQLIRLKLEGIFVNATIITINQNELETFKHDLPDLFLSTLPMAQAFEQVPIIHIDGLLSEYALQRVKNMTFIRLKGTYQHQLIELFDEVFFERVSGDYLDLVQSMCRKMVETGYAAADFPELVMEREKKFTTIYQNGVAGPHSMKLNAHKNVIGVIILDDKAHYQGRDVKVIFVINLMPGCLFLHKELSWLLLYLIEHDVPRERLIASRNLKQFKAELKKIL